MSKNNCSDHAAEGDPVYHCFVFIIEAIALHAYQKKQDKTKINMIG